MNTRVVLWSAALLTATVLCLVDYPAATGAKNLS